jgi:hypothetical protein
VIPKDPRKPFDVREIIARLVDGSEFDEFKARFGATLVTDTCWCMLTEPVVPPSARTIITNSAKYAHYGPGLVGRRLRFANLAGCVEAATSGRAPTKQPSWLANSMGSTRAVHLGRYARTASARALRTIL